jgi:hypothetical protein
MPTAAACFKKSRRGVFEDMAGEHTKQAKFAKLFPYS